ncbi:hypothetical protein JTE90_023078 [Oedothorax gibbosus]|uniref:Uncharacterized protein n=1 Tax=Oedothorax gibbosus TaxID=931172 RepID=A0AAV6UY22_9ARAC|nr:hypothetical protein JTE90_023078 [Oedothorax gibbosus]
MLLACYWSRLANRLRAVKVGCLLDPPRHRHGSSQLDITARLLLSTTVLRQLLTGAIGRCSFALPHQ